MKWYSTPSPNLSPYIFLGLDPSPPPLSLSFRQLRCMRRHRRQLVFKCCNLCVYTYVYVHICIYVQEYAYMYVCMDKCVFMIAVCACDGGVCARECTSVSELSLAAYCVLLSMLRIACTYRCCVLCAVIVAAYCVQLSLPTLYQC